MTNAVQTAAYLVQTTGPSGGPFYTISRDGDVRGATLLAESYFIKNSARAVRVWDERHKRVATCPDSRKEASWARFQ